MEKHNASPPPSVNTNPPLASPHAFFVADLVSVGNRCGIVALVFTTDVLIRLDPAYGRPAEWCVAPVSQVKHTSFQSVYGEHGIIRLLQSATKLRPNAFVGDAVDEPVSVAAMTVNVLEGSTSVMDGTPGDGKTFAIAGRAKTATLISDASAALERAHEDINQLAGRVVFAAEVMAAVVGDRSLAITVENGLASASEAAIELAHVVVDRVVAAGLRAAI